MASLQVTRSFCISTGHCELFCCCVMVFSSLASWVSHIRSTLAIRCLALRVFCVATCISTRNLHFCNSASNKISYPELVRTPFCCLFTCLSSCAVNHHRRTTQSAVSPPLFLTSLFLLLQSVCQLFFTHSLLTNYVTGLM